MTARQKYWLGLLGSLLATCWLGAACGGTRHTPG